MYVRLYRLLLRLFPPAFRAEYGREMERLLRDRLREARQSGRWRLGLWAHAMGDALLEGTRERLRGWRVDVRGPTAGSGRGRGGMMEGWLQDIRYAVRSLVKRPGFTAAAVATLALGLGAVVSIFSVVNGVLMRPLPFAEPDELRVLWTRYMPEGRRGRGMDHPDIRAMQASVPALSVAGYSTTRQTLSGLGDPEALFGVQVTDGLIDLMGLEPALGRDLSAADDVDGGPRVVVVSHAFWTERLGRDPEAIGRTVTLNDEPWEVVGVAPRGFDFPDGAELWLPRRHQADGCGHGCRILVAVARLVPGASDEEAASQLDALAARLAEEHPDAHREALFELQPMLEHEVAEVRTALWVLLGAVGMVLLIACANVANLMMVRANARTAEVALRAALGASRLRILRQLLAESAVIALAAGLLGLGLAHWGTAGLIALAPDSLPRLDGVAIDTSVLAFALLLVAATIGLFGLAPALGATRRPLEESLGKGRGSSDAGRRFRGAGSLLLVGEVALSVVLLLGSGLLLRTLAEMQRVELGFDVEGIERFRTALPESRYDSLEIPAFLGRLEEELETIPGVQAAGWGFGVPFAPGSMSTSVGLLDRPEVPPSDRPSLEVRPASTGFLAATGVELVRGRWFDERDVYGAPAVAVVNEAAVRAHYAGVDPLGRMIGADVSWSFAATPPRTIVGVVRDVAEENPRQEPAPALYLPNAQFGVETGYFFLRLAPGVETALPEARRAVARLDPGLAIWDAGPVEEAVAEARAPNVFYATLLGVFSVLALVLAAVGLYGVVAYAVSRRTRELGIRMALGARGDSVVGMVLGQGMRPALLGLGLGLVAFWFGARVLESMLYGVSPQDPLTIAAATALLLLVVAAATLVPARRASRIAPASALRAE